VSSLHPSHQTHGARNSSVPRKRYRILWRRVALLAAIAAAGVASIVAIWVHPDTATDQFNPWVILWIVPIGGLSWFLNKYAGKNRRRHLRPVD
jgi:cytochrome bd-type quinol oxidase subunit 2